MKKRGTLPNQWQDGGHGPSYSCLVVEDPSNKLRYVMHRFDVANWTEETVTNITKYYSTLVERSSSSPVWSAALRVLNSARQSHYFNVVGEFSRLGSFPAFLSSCLSDGSRPRRVGSIGAGFGRWVTKLATSLASMHELGVVHGDVRFTSLFMKNSDASVVSGEDPDLGDLDALLLGTPMPFAHPSLTATSAAAMRQRKAPTLPPSDSSTARQQNQQPPSSPEGYNVIPPVHESILCLMRAFVNPPELSANQSSSNQQQVKSDAACDVYQFGCLMALLIAAFRIFLHGANDSAVRNASCSSVESLMSNLVRKFSPRLFNLLSSMTNVNPAARPSMQRVLKDLNSNALQNEFTSSLFAEEEPSTNNVKTSAPSSPFAKGNNSNNSNNNISTSSSSGAGAAVVGLATKNNHPTLQPESIEATRIDSSNNNTRGDGAAGGDESFTSDSAATENDQHSTTSSKNPTTPNSRNRRSIAEARLKQRQKQQQQENGGGAGNKSSFSPNSKNGNKQMPLNNSDDSWLLNAEKRLQQLEELKQEHDQNSPTKLQKMQHQQQQHQNHQDPQINHHQQPDHLNETPPGPMMHSPPKQQQRPQQQKTRSPVIASSSPGVAFQKPSPPPPTRGSVSPDPQKPPGYGAHVRSPIHHYHYKTGQQNAGMNNNNNKKENNNNTNNRGGGAGTVGTAASHLHELRNMRKHERNALLEKQEREQEERREHFLQMRAEKERKQEAERKAFLERQQAHAAHLKQIKQAKRGIVEAVKMQQHNNNNQDGGGSSSNTGNNNNHDQNNHNNNNNNNNDITLLQPQEDVQIFVKRSGQVMRCDDATGFVPMTEEEKNNSPVLQRQRDQNHHHQPSQQQQQNRQFHPQVHHHFEVDEDGNEKSDGNLISSVRMQMDQSSKNGTGTSTTTTTLTSTTGDENDIGTKKADENNSHHHVLASPSALSTQQMSQQPGMQGRERHLEEDPTQSVNNNNNNNSRTTLEVEESPIPVAPTTSSSTSNTHQGGEVNHNEQQEQQHHATDPLSSLSSLLGAEAMQPLMAEVEVFSKAPAHVRCHPRANAVFATRVRSIVESSVMPKLTVVFGVATEEEGFMALLVMLGQVLMMTQHGSPVSSSATRQQMHQQQQQSPNTIAQADADFL